jgi:hypothetical protein
MVSLALAAPIWAATPGQQPGAGGELTAADANAAQYCPDLHFVAYSTLETGGQRYEESISWDSVEKAYVIKGPVLAYLLDDPGVDSIPSGLIPQTAFRIAIRVQLSRPVDRFCQENFREAAQCDVHGQITYTQIYTDCEQQTLKHITTIVPDSAGSLPLLDLSYADVQGNFSAPLVLAAGSDLRLRIRN